ncbi:hypothetical protein O1L60_19955 [Streptomyces diastatochromogenes]|nr:hypothetical protein [Streptomyces diastatochromogenes]
MSRTSTILGNTQLVVDTGMAKPDATTIVERKGLGHPDTLADHLAERLSRAYSRYTVERFGAVLHHNFDKLALLGGASEVRYGAGRMTAPVRVLVNGRAAPMCGGERIPVEEIVEAEVRAFFARRLPEVSDHLDITFNITSNSSPVPSSRATRCPTGRGGSTRGRSRTCGSGGCDCPTTRRWERAGRRRTSSSRSCASWSTTSPARVTSASRTRGADRT